MIALLRVLSECFQASSARSFSIREGKLNTAEFSNTTFGCLGVYHGLSAMVGVLCGVNHNRNHYP